MFKKILEARKHRNMIKKSSTFILEEFSNIIIDVIRENEKNWNIPSEIKKEVIKFESMALLFWLFQKISIFWNNYQKLLLDEIHKQYYSRLEKHGYTFDMKQLVCNDFNIRYEKYNSAYNQKDFIKVWTKFISYVSERAKLPINIKDIEIPLKLFEYANYKFDEWKESMI